MKIVIDIPKDVYEECKRIGDSSDTLFEAIRKGEVLPKGHDRLIYAKDVGEYLTLADVPTIIEADKEAENESE